jgi:photosystem II stability/assembly factor-like uncharacterized protein
VTSVYFSDASTGWVSYGSGEMLYTTDGGDSWTQQFQDLYCFVTLGASGNSNIWGFGPTGKVFHSGDGGSNWDEQAAPTSAILNGAHFINGSTGWCVGTEGTILYTNNGGSDWDPQWSGTDETLMDVHFPDAQNGWAVGLKGIVLQASNGGVSLEERSSEAKRIELHPNPARDRVEVGLAEVHSEALSVSLRDARGREIRTWEEKLDGAEPKFTLELEELDKGIHFLEIEGGDETAVKKLVVE